MNQRVTHQTAYHKGNRSADAMVRHLHRIVTYGPWDLDVSFTMSAYGYDEVKWAEGQVMLAELVSCDAPGDATLTAAAAWYDEAATTARRALAAHPELLVKLGLNGTDST